MVKRTGPTSPYVKKLIEKLKIKAAETGAPIWKDLAARLEKPRRQKISVNLIKINKYAPENSAVLVPGVVLGSGQLEKKVKIAALRFSKSAIEKIKNSGSEAMTIEELVDRNPKGSNIKIIG